jgi:hypothetical protein
MKLAPEQVLLLIVQMKMWSSKFGTFLSFVVGLCCVVVCGTKNENAPKNGWLRRRKSNQAFLQIENNNNIPVPSDDDTLQSVPYDTCILRRTTKDQSYYEVQILSSVWREVQLSENPSFFHPSWHCYLTYPSRKLQKDLLSFARSPSLTTPSLLCLALYRCAESYLCSSSLKLKPSGKQVKRRSIIYLVEGTVKVLTKVTRKMISTQIAFFVPITYVTSPWLAKQYPSKRG